MLARLVRFQVFVRPETSRRDVALLLPRSDAVGAAFPVGHLHSAPPDISLRDLNRLPSSWPVLGGRGAFASRRVEEGRNERDRMSGAVARHLVAYLTEPYDRLSAVHNGHRAALRLWSSARSTLSRSRRTGRLAATAGVRHRGGLGGRHAVDTRLRSPRRRRRGLGLLLVGRVAAAVGVGRPSSDLISLRILTVCVWPRVVVLAVVVIDVAVGSLSVSVLIRLLVAVLIQMRVDEAAEYVLV